ncbi:SURF1 family protein [Azotobacter salinestris]|uniref:SURF1 family protein n=1 Tax=Azotobacter salinestris TaxID=69964 RepID=UPI0032DE3FF7
MQYSPPSRTPGRLPWRRFRPGWAPSLLVALLLPVLIGLGFWQLSRAEDKRALLDQFEARRQAEPLALMELEAAGAPAWQRVRLHGRLDPQHSLLLDSRTRAGRPGVELLQPFRDDSGRWLLVNRGWLPWPDRRVPPAFSTPDEPLTLTAWIYRSPGNPFLPEGNAGDTWPRLVNRVDAAALWHELGRDGLPVELRLEAGPAAYAVDWPLLAMAPEKHLGYAVQWFALAAALLVLFVYLGIHRARETSHALTHRPD